MFVGLLRLRLYMRGNQSLKDKRNILRRIKDRVRNEFNVSIAEVGENDRWDTALIGISTVGNDSAFAGSTLDAVTRFIENMYVAEIVERDVNVIHSEGSVVPRSTLPLGGL